jgi:hypothetical protein
MREQPSFVLLTTEFRRRSTMKVKVLLLVVSIASLFAALVCAQGIVVDRSGSEARGINVETNAGKPRPPHWF